MIRLSIQARQALVRLTLPVLIVASFGLMLLGKADTLVVERARVALADGLAPIYAMLAPPLGRIHAAASEVAALWDMREENARLRAENESLRRWQSVALALDAENQRLKASLHWIPDPDAAFVTARVVADAGGVYARAVLLSVGPNHGIRKGDIAVDERGLVGRITEVGSRTARVLLITDLNSRIPVIMESSRAHAIMVGTNGPRPRLLFWPEGTPPQENERIVTSAEANAFPANLPIGTVHYTGSGVFGSGSGRSGSGPSGSGVSGSGPPGSGVPSGGISGGGVPGSGPSGSGVPEVDPAAMLQKLEIVRIFDYGLGGVTAPEPQRQAQDRPTPGRH